MREFFRERTEWLRDVLVRYEPFRKKYYAGDCQFDSQQHTVEYSDKEEILEVIRSDDGEIQVITIKPPLRGLQWRVRYHLKIVGDKWQISAGEYSCIICMGTGKRKDGTKDCTACKGTGWHETK